MNPKIQFLKREILRHQEELVFIVEKYGAGSWQALLKSQLLDKLINEISTLIKKY